MFFRRFLVVLAILIISSLFQSFSAQTGTIRGFVYNQKNREPVIFGNVFLKGTTMGTTTDVNGFFSISRVPAGTYTLEFRAPGFDSLAVSVTLEAGKIVTRNLDVKERSVELKTFEVSGEREEERSRVSISTTTITPKEMNRLPSVGAEPDIAQYLQVLPGVTFTGDQGGQLYIRGGSPIQNKVLLDGMIIYNPFHSIGLFSVFDTDIIRNAEVYTGGFGANYGGRISSIMDITTRDGSKKRFGGKVSGSPFVSKLQLEGPLFGKKNSETPRTASFILSSRTSYLKESSKVFYPYVDTAGLPFNFTDLYGKVSFSSDNGSKFNLSTFNFSDKVRYQSLQDLNWNTFGIGSNFVLVPSSTAVLFDGNFSYSKYGIKLKEANRPDRSSDISGFNLGLNFKYFIGKSDVQYGFEAVGFSTNYLFYNELNRKIEQAEHNTELAGYVRYRGVFNKLVIEPGIRLQYYASVQEMSPEPRLALKYNLHDKFRIKLAGGIYSQNLIAGVSDRDVVNLFYGFLSSPESLPKTFMGETLKSKLQRGRHMIAGFEWNMSRRLKLNAETYRFDFTQLAAINRNKIFNDDQFNLNEPDLLKKDYLIERGYSQGVDLLLKYDLAHFNIWAVYSLMWVERQDEVMSYSPVWDRRHNVNLLMSYEFGEGYNWEASIRWNYGSGFPFTQTQGYYEQNTLENNLNGNYIQNNGTLATIYGELNQGRLPDFHRLDVNIRYTLALSDNARMEFTAGATNVYNRENIFYFNRVKYQRVNQLPVLPSLGVNFHF